MIATIAVIAAILRKKINFSDRSDHSDHTRPLSSDRSDRSDNSRWDIKSYIVAGRCDRWRVVSIWSLNFFFSAIAAITAIVSIIWKAGLIYRNNNPLFLLNFYLQALQTYRTHSSKLRVPLFLLFIFFFSFLEEISFRARKRMKAFCLQRFDSSDSIKL